MGEMARQGAIGMEDLIRNKVSKIRHWKMTALGKKRPKWGFEFTLMTYNILSQTAAEGHMYLYRKCNPHYLSEEYRISRLLPEILKSKSDVVCLQEVEQYLYDQRIQKVFDSNGFGSIFKKRTGSKSDGCAIIWRRAKFSLLKYQEVEYKAKGCEYLNKDNVGLIAVLRPLHPQATETQLHVATTHLIFNPRRGDVKLCQLRLLLAELEKSSFKGIGENGRQYHPVILCGDFNFEPHSPLYRFVETGRLDICGLISGNMSGQHEGKDKGRKLFPDRLALDGVGIDESGRFSAGESSSNSQRINSVDCCSKGSNSVICEKKAESSNSYRFGSCNTLENMIHSTQLNFKDLERSLARTSSSFARELSTSSSDSDSDDKSAHIFYHDFNFVPTYKYYHQDRKSYPITSMTGNDCNIVDHIFYNVMQKSSTSYVEDKLKLLGIYSLPHAEDLKEFGGLPNAHLGSDHISLMSKFIISFKH